MAAKTTPTFGCSNIRYPPAIRTLPGADTVTLFIGIVLYYITGIYFFCVFERKFNDMKNPKISLFNMANLAIILNERTLDFPGWT